MWKNKNRVKPTALAEPIPGKQKNPTGGKVFFAIVGGSGLYELNQAKTLTLCRQSRNANLTLLP